MIHLFRLARSHPKASAANIQNCASIPSSGFNFNDKSQGASAATAELADALGGALNQIDVVEISTGMHRSPRPCNISKLGPVPWQSTYSNPTPKIPDTRHHRFPPSHVILPSRGGTF
ncbi:hypothetical protein QBC42DRAFT_268456 [Cladorrhinum samala]|uniref:Uncharacterized protein n=1 Tax=Cladorrhinum samala TaxID=585594 RepID=A0AAV9HMZ6_9PEZI|nr:hypothetical protein QBC42DRAFT_268456 [Cladorrhinum samala]